MVLRNYIFYIIINTLYLIHCITISDQSDCSDVRCPPLFCPDPIKPEEGDCCDTCLEGKA